MNEAQYDELADEADTTYLSQSGAAAIPEGLSVIAILMAVLQAILAACPTPQTGARLKTAADSPSRFTQGIFDLALRRELRDRHGWGAWREYDGPALSATGLSMVRAQPVEMIDSCCRMCR